MKKTWFPQRKKLKLFRNLRLEMKKPKGDFMVIVSFGAKRVSELLISSYQKETYLEVVVDQMPGFWIVENLVQANEFQSRKCRNINNFDSDIWNAMGTYYQYTRNKPEQRNNKIYIKLNQDSLQICFKFRSFNNSEPYININHRLSIHQAHSSPPLIETIDNFVSKKRILSIDQQTMLRNLTRLVRMPFWKKKKTDLEILEQQLQTKENLGPFIKNILKNNETKPKLLEPKTDDKLTVVMEMDQILIYSFTPDQEGYLLAPMRPYDHYHELDEYNALLSIYKRKNLDNFLNYVSEECEPIIWTTAVPEYTELIMGLIDPQKRIKTIFTQQQCERVVIEDQELDEYMKDLNLLNRNLERTVYIDARPLSYWMYPHNCMATEAFRADYTMRNEDLNLMILELEKLRKMKDIRPYLKDKHKIEEHLKECNML